MNLNILLVLLLLTQEATALPRNPFQPPESPCAAVNDRLQRWRLYGVISAETGSVAIMRDAQQNWRRVRKGMPMVPGASVAEIARQYVSVVLPSECAQPVYVWKIKGKNYGLDALIRAADGMAADQPRG